MNWAPTSRHPAYRDAISKDTEDDSPADEPETIEGVLLRLEGGYPVSYGSAEDLGQREIVFQHLGALRSELAGLSTPTPGIGHNGPPEDDEVPSFLEVEASIAEIGSELGKVEPDAVKVATATSLIARAGKWLRSRFEKVAEKAVEDTIRLAWGSVAITVGVKLGLPDLIQKLTD